MHVLVGLLGGWMAWGVAVIISPPRQTATSNLGQAKLKRDVCFGACQE